MDLLKRKRASLGQTNARTSLPYAAARATIEVVALFV